MESVPGAVATGSKPIAIIEIGGIVTRSLPLPVLTSSSNWDATRRRNAMTDTTDIGNQLRLDLLREALPYIRRFKGKTFVVKCSGKVTEDHESLISLAEE